MLEDLSAQERQESFKLSGVPQPQTGHQQNEIKVVREEIHPKKNKMLISITEVTDDNDMQQDSDEDEMIGTLLEKQKKVLTSSTSTSGGTELNDPY